MVFHAGLLLMNAVWTFYSLHNQTSPWSSPSQRRSRGYAWAEGMNYTCISLFEVSRSKVVHITANVGESSAVIYSFNIPLTVVLKFSWQILQEASPIKFFMSLEKSEKPSQNPECITKSSINRWTRKLGKWYSHTALNTAPMIAEWAGKDSVKLVHPLLRRWLSSWLSLPHASTSFLPSNQTNKAVIKSPSQHIYAVSRCNKQATRKLYSQQILKRKSNLNYILWKTYYPMT